MNKKIKFISISDLFQSFQKYHIILTLGWNDVSSRYRRSRVGPFWLTINLAVMIGALGLVFGSVLGSPMNEFLPFFCVGLIFWSFLSTSISEGCGSLQESSSIILQMKLPLWVYFGRVIYRNLIILFHNILIIPIVFFIFSKPVSLVSLLVIPGLLLNLLNLLWIVAILGILCTRFRDVTLIVANFLQMMMFVTPIMWGTNLRQVKISPLVYDYNPFYHLISICRAPLLNAYPSHLNWIVAASLAIMGWLFAIWFYERQVKRVPYWL
jgi:ABC-type polysaccharide/polyol phosphate export permease